MNNLQSIIIREPQLSDENQFLEAMQRSNSFHHSWVNAPTTHEEFLAYFERYQQTNQKSYWVIAEKNNIVGVFNINEIVRGCFQNAYLGFYAVADYAGKGYMSAGLKMVLKKSYRTRDAGGLTVVSSPKGCHCKVQTKLEITFLISTQSFFKLLLMLNIFSNFSLFKSYC